MKILLYTENEKLVAGSGVGRAVKHQMKALELAGVDYTRKKRDEYDLVHINTVGIGSLRLADKAHKKGKKVIMHGHSTEEDYKDSFFFANKTSKLFKKWLIKAYSKGDLIVTPTPYSKKVLDSYNINKEIIPVSNGVDLEKFKKDAVMAKKFRKEYGFTKDEKIVLCVGLQIKRKGILDVIEIASKNPDITFVWCGYTNKTLMTKDVRAAIKKAPDNLNFLGYIRNMIGAYSAASIFFFPTYEETEGIVVLEALAMSLQVIVRDIPVFDSWLNDSTDCYKAKNNEQFTNLIRSLLDEKLPTTVKKGYMVAQARSLEKIGEELKTIYEKALLN